MSLGSNSISPDGSIGTILRIELFVLPKPDFAGDAGDLSFRKVNPNSIPAYTRYDYQFDVTPVDDIPTDIQLSNASVDENSQGAGIGLLTTTDPDAGNYHTYQLLGDLSGLFEIVGSTLKLKSGLATDYETAISHELLIRTIDNTGLAFEKTITVSVNDIADTNFTGTSGDDEIIGTTAGDVINRLEGNDILSGSDGNDIINGGSGSD